ncbi:MAG: hypothetical protein QCI82_04750 [Candidatus Thermoplasmatota archaeon]|nr:hypothetical protein [Candidatus Thermoplasmatota archaeon]
MRKWVVASIVTLLFLFSVISSGCLEIEEEKEGEEGDDVIIVPETTQQLGGDVLDYIESVSDDASKIVFYRADLSHIDRGDIISFGISKHTPYGLLRRVVGIERSGSRVALETEQATLEEAVKEGRVEYNQTLSGPLKTIHSLPGVTMENERTRSGLDAVSFEDVVLHEEGGSRLLLDGYLDLDFDLLFVLEMEDFSIVDCTFGAKSTFHGELVVTSEGEIDIDSKLEVARYQFPPFIIPMGAIEIVIVPVLSLTIGTRGSVAAGTSMRALQNTDVEVRVAHPNWDPIKDFTSNFEYDTPSLSDGISIRCQAGPEMQVLIYGVLGPYISARGYVMGESAGESWWLYGGLSFGMGFRIEVLGVSIKDWENSTIIDFRRLIASSMEDMAQGWVVEKVDYAAQLTIPIMIRNPDGDMAIVYTSIDPETGYFPIKMALLKDGTWSFEDLVRSNSDDTMDACFGPDGGIVLAYYHGGMSSRIHLVFWNGRTVRGYEYKDSDLAGRFVSEMKLTMDDEGRPNLYYVLYKNTGGGFFRFEEAILKRAVFEDGGFSNETIVSGDGISITGLDLKRAKDDALHLTYFKVDIDAFTQELVHHRYADGVREDQSVFHEDVVWNNPSSSFMDIDEKDDPVLLFDDNNGTFQFMRYTDGRWITGDPPGVKTPNLGLVSLHLLEGVDPVCGHISSSGSQARSLYYSVLKEDGWDRVEVFNWTGWRHPGGTDISQTDERLLVAFNDGLFLRVARRDV